jgi:NADP-dependent 3-hydroxy acid dehydrogenase YdfG
MSQQTQKIALITGANRGIGFETARQLGQQGIKVLVGARSEKSGTEAENKLKNEGFDAEFVLLDVDDAKTHESAAKFIEKKYGKLDVLINNAGISLEFDGLRAASEKIGRRAHCLFVERSGFADIAQRSEVADL